MNFDSGVDVEVAKFAGFCYGVKNAVNLTREALEKEQNVYSTDHIVHNQIINDEFEEHGMHFVDSIDEIPEGSTIILRAHGVGRTTIEACENRKLKTINTRLVMPSRLLVVFPATIPSMPERRQ